MMEFHISRAARDRYDVSEVLFNFVGNVIFGDLAASRELANRINEVRGTSDNPAEVVNPGALFAMGLIDEVSHALIAHYRNHVDPSVMTEALAWFGSRIGHDDLDGLLRAFVTEFPNVSIYRNRETVDKWLEGSTQGISHREIAMEELLMLWLANQNLAFRPFLELFDDARLAKTSAYPTVTAALGDYFDTRPKFTAKAVSLLHMLRAPMLAAPDSLTGQLNFIRENWSEYLGESFRRILLAMDVLKEEDIAIWMRFHPPSEQQRRRPFHPDPLIGQAEVPVYSKGDPEYERFSQDQAWMPTVVMIAKSTYVWLAQLSRQYGRQIERLDQIPDEELDLLASRGMNALWLIGVWERSSASKTIKRLCGQPDAVASAYSLANYGIAYDLGGDAAYANLRDRAAARGIRLASDMVPNHMGIDSNWVIEHPEWFLSRPDCPYPAYRFDGPDLSQDGRVEIKIEDHYYQQTDAAVVFRRRDKYTGHIEYVYHGNDGTSFPWNDTAQLNYLSAHVREQVMQTILHVARRFPIIRFDAAMTLARRHVQRLWFPIPGSGGAIPSRAECSMTQAEFDAAMPHEFWREVVDRVAVEVPGTLLLAEAFWLMEGYFVRTLGMHRVYNSAFMIMLRDEDNAKYRSVLKNTIEFDPDILKRYVNFMSNPDERTAVDQFGTGDKYFGACTMMATLPGLPMFGHGQVEAFTERYGMEYKRPRHDEHPNQNLVARHQREIAPLLKNRSLFTDSSNFLLYDFWREDGTVDENVFAYSNRQGDQRAIVLFHNCYAETRGTLHRSTGYADKASGTVRQRNLHEGLQFPSNEKTFLAYQDAATGLHYLRPSTELTHHGLTVNLRAYQYAVLQNWRELVVDQEHRWDQLCDSLQGAGVGDLDEALAMLKLRPVHNALRAALDPSVIQQVIALASPVAKMGPTVRAMKPKKQVAKPPKTEQSAEDVLTLFCKRGEVFLQEALSGHLSLHAEMSKSGPVENLKLRDPVRHLAEALLLIPEPEKILLAPEPVPASDTPLAEDPKQNAIELWATMLSWCLARALMDSLPRVPSEENPLDIFDRLRLRAAFAEIFQALGFEAEERWRAAARIRILLMAGREKQVAPTKSAIGISASLWKNPDVAWLTQLHPSNGHTYFRMENYEQLIRLLLLPHLAGLAKAKHIDSKAVLTLEGEIKSAMEIAAAAGYELDTLLQSTSSMQSALGKSSKKPASAKKNIRKR